MPETSSSDWDAFLAHYPDAHILQTSTWGQLKAEFGWQTAHVTAEDCGAQILFKRFLPGINLAYIPKGPVGTNWEQLWPEIDELCVQRKCVLLKVEPDLWESPEIAAKGSAFQLPKGFIQSVQGIQPVRTIIIDIRGDEAQILGRMKQKTRYNINLALKKGIVVKPHSELAEFYGLMTTTGQRDRFGIHSLVYYQRAYELFHERDLCQLLLAEYQEMPLSALIVFGYGHRAWYFYGASSNEHRERMPNYPLQWEAMRWARSHDCSEYDLWGVPDEDLNTLEANFARRTDGLWGVYRFKRGFGGELRRAVGAWDRVYNPLLYRLYQLWLKVRKVEG
jgi:lipid II:glycine glycyltransferase (peptidoglycan interpeptide bridge formation enzyme)